MPRRASVLLVLALGLSVLRTADARPTVVERRSFYEYLLSADDVLVVQVDSTGGPRYGKWAQVSVRRSFKGTVTSDSLLASVVTGADARDLRLRAAQLMRRHGTRRPDALAHALGAAGSLSHLDDVVAYAPPPCAGTHGPGVFAAAWQTITGWIWGDAERPERPWTPTVFCVLQDLGRAYAETPQPVMDALGPYLACRRFEGVSIVAAKTLFALDPVAARPVLRDRLAQDPTPRVRETLRHLVWVSSQIDSS